jgi:hypothetical protein
MDYREAPAEVLTLVQTVKERFFGDMVSANIKVLFDTKPKLKSWLAYISKPSQLVRYLTSNPEIGQPEEGWDYILVIDELPWEHYSEDDKMRLIRHELRHCEYNPESEERSKQYGIAKHDYEDFYAEVLLASQENELKWRVRASEVAASVYEDLKEKEKEKKKTKLPVVD